MFALALCLCAPLQSTWYVDDDGTAPGTGTQTDPYTRIDYAVAQPSTLAGDTVLVRSGTYLNEAIDFAGKDLVIESVFGPFVTQIEAANMPSGPTPIVRASSGESLASVLEGFTLNAKGGEPFGAFGGTRGGAVYCAGSSLSLRNCRLRASTIQPTVTASLGAGIYIENGTISVEDCVFEDLGEEAGGALGGGLYGTEAAIRIKRTTIRRCNGNAGLGLYAVDSSLVVEESSFTENVGSLGFGGAMALRNCTLFMSDCEVSHNRPGTRGAGIHASEGTQLTVRNSRFEGNSYGADVASGAGIYMDSTASAIVTDSVFQANLGQFGAAIFGTATIEGCLFEGNQVWGSGQFLLGGGALSGQGSVRRSIFKNNTASDRFTVGGGAVSGAWVLDYCTFVGNEAVVSGGGGSVPSTAQGPIAMSNCIVRGGTAPRLDMMSGSANHTNIEGDFPGVGNFDRPDSLWSDLALLPGSPSIDSADATDPLDADGTRADRGAIPFDPFYCGPGCFGVLGSSTCVANVNSTGLDAKLTAQGNPVADENRLVLNVTDSPSGSLGYFLASRSVGSQMLGGGSQGLLCLGGSILRLSNAVLDDRGTGVVSFQAPLNDMPQGNVVLAGETWAFQYWFRDANPGLTSNTSSNVVLTFL